MKFTVKSSELSRKLKTVIRGFDSQDESSFVSLSIKHDTNESPFLEVIARSRATFFKAELTVGALELTPGEAKTHFVSGDTIKQIAGILPTAPIDVSFAISDETRSFSVKYTGASFKLPVISDMAAVEVPEYNELFTVQARDIMPVMRDLLKITSTDSSAQEHQSSCLQVVFGDKGLALSATDSYAFAEVVVPASANSELEKYEALVRHPQAAALIGTFTDTEMLTFCGTEDKSMFGYLDEYGTLQLVGVTSLPPIDFYALISDHVANEQSFTVEKSELKSAIDTVEKLAFGENYVTITAEPNEAGIVKFLKVTNRMGDTVQVPVLNSEIDETVTLNYISSILLSSLVPVVTEQVRLEFKREGRSIVKFTPILKDGSDLKSATIGSTIFASGV